MSPFKLISKETGAAPLLMLFAVVGLVAFIAISSIAPFKSGILSALYPKTASRAASDLKDQVKAKTIPDQYIVVYQRNIKDPDSVTEDLKLKHGAEVKHKYKETIKGFSGKIPASKLDAVKKDPRVRYVEPDVEVEIPVSEYVPAGMGNIFDKYFSKLFKKTISPQVSSTGLQRIGGSTDGISQTVTSKGDGVGVAVLDSGISEHPDLSVVEKVAIENGETVEDEDGHGTHVAGIIAAAESAEGSYGGVVGVAPKVSLYSVKVLDKNGNEPGTLVQNKSTVVRGVDWVAARDGAVGTPGKIQIVNMSIGGFGIPTKFNEDCLPPDPLNDLRNDSLHEAICLSVKEGTTYIVSAGNERSLERDSDASHYYPAGYDEVITVSAIADFDGKPGELANRAVDKPFNMMSDYNCNQIEDDAFGCFSNSGEAVDIAAPGVNILSTLPMKKYGGLGFGSGTSMAAPFVAGAAALYKSTHPIASPAEIKAALITSVEPIDIPGDPDEFKEGILQIGQSPAFTFTAQPSGGNPGTAFGIQPVVTLKYPNGQVVRDFNKPVTIAIKAGTSTSGAILFGNTTVNAVKGVATFSGLSINKAGAGYVLTVAALGSDSAESNPLNIVSTANPDSWTSLPSEGAPIPRTYHTAVWTGSSMIVWGGIRRRLSNSSTISDFLADGAEFDPTNNIWTTISTLGAPSPRISHTAIWTSAGMIVWGGNHLCCRNILGDGAIYNPTSGNWTPVQMSGAPGPHTLHTAVWTGTEMIVWGGENPSLSNDGGRYNPSTNSWSPISTNGAPSERIQHTAVWTGTEMIVWGGSNGTFLGDGARYNPSTDTWIPLPAINAPSPRVTHAALWTGTEMIVWGGHNGTQLGDGASFNPSTNKWTPLSALGAPAPRSDVSAVSTGTDMIVWGGPIYSAYTNDGARYNYANNTWAPLTMIGVPKPRAIYSAVWSGSEMIIWGGEESNGNFLNDGGRYTP